MSKPLVAAVDPRREDVAPAALDNLHPEYARALRLDIERALRRVAAAVEAAGVPVTTTVVAADGSPALALHEFAEDADARLLVLGSSARGPIGRLRRRHRSSAPPRALPGGGCAGRLLVRGRRRGTRPDRRRVHRHAGRARRARHEAASAVVRLGTEALPDDRFAGGQILSGRPADALAAASEDLGLLVCGSRGYGPLRTLLLGGTSHALVRKAACPVLVVPPGSSEHDATGDRSSGRTVAA